MENWKDIPGFEGLYQVSDCGRIKSLDRRVWNKANSSLSTIKGQIKKLDTNGKLYAQINLAKDGKYKKCLVHRLVAIAFVQNNDHLPEVNHVDLNKFNNCSSNLEWTTRMGNAKHAQKNGAYSKFPKGSKKPNAVLTDDAVRHIRKQDLRNIEYCRLYNIKPPTVTMIQRDKNRWRHVV